MCATSAEFIWLITRKYHCAQTCVVFTTLTGPFLSSVHRSITIISANVGKRVPAREAMGAFGHTGLVQTPSNTVNRGNDCSRYHRRSHGGGDEPVNDIHVSFDWSQITLSVLLAYRGICAVSRPFPPWINVDPRLAILRTGCAKFVCSSEFTGD